MNEVRLPDELKAVLEGGMFSGMPWRFKTPDCIVDVDGNQIFRAVAFHPNFGILKVNDGNCLLLAALTHWLPTVSWEIKEYDRFTLLQNEVVAWANQVLPGRKPNSALLKLFEEVGELVRNPKAAGEYADILIMLLDLAHMHGIDLLSAGFEKLQINRERTWAISPLGTLQHVEGGE